MKPDQSPKKSGPTHLYMLGMLAGRVIRNNKIEKKAIPAPP
jgi:hypothetical protein